MAKANPKMRVAGYIARRKRLRKKALRENGYELGPMVSVVWKYGVLYICRIERNLYGEFETNEWPISGVPVVRRPGFVSEGPQPPKERTFRNRQRITSVSKRSSGYGSRRYNDDW